MCVVYVDARSQLTGEANLRMSRKISARRPPVDGRHKSGAQAIGSFVPKVARAVFEAKGFPSAAVLVNWPAIVGRDLAAFTAPERLIWPRRRAERDEDGAVRTHTLRTSRRGATLVLRVDGPRALEIQHTAPQLIERINTYFGYGAVSALRLVQAPVRRTRVLQRDPPPDEPEVDPGDLEQIENEALRRALVRLRSRVA